jgi:hypothetical protein
MWKKIMKNSTLDTKREYWYFISIWYCPQCGRSTEVRERRYDKRPDKYEDRHEIVEAWDYCDW